MSVVVADFLTACDGEVVFVPRAPGESVTRARERTLAEGFNVASFEVDEVEMLPIPEHFINVDAEWWMVTPGTPGAVAYWRFQL